MIRILLVDDDPGWLAIMSKAAVGTDREVAKAKNEEEALKRIKEESFDLVVTDLELVSGKDDHGGLAVLKAAKQKDIYTQVIVCTGLGTEEVSVDAMVSGAFDYLERRPKAINHRKMLEQKIARALEFRDAKLNARKGQ